MAGNPRRFQMSKTPLAELDRDQEELDRDQADLEWRITVQESAFKRQRNRDHGLTIRTVHDLGAEDRQPTRFPATTHST
jgi:hypothetical protein